jgi:hypothetical protein
MERSFSAWIDSAAGAGFGIFENQLAHAENFISVMISPSERSAGGKLRR